MRGLVKLFGVVVFQRSMVDGEQNLMSGWPKDLV